MSKIEMRVMSSEHGDKPYTFDPAEASVATAEARAVLERVFKGGGAVFKVGPTGETLGRVKSFEELGEKNIAVPQLKGG